MADFAALEREFTSALSLTRRPVAIAFRESPPAGVSKLEGSQPSGCSFWRLAANGQTFYTVPSDHYNCPVGSYTHNIPLPQERETELPQLLSVMVNVGYLKMEEVPGIPRLSSTPAVTVYSPLAAAPVAPDAVILTGSPARLMLLHEAATRAAVGARHASEPLALLGRPTCMAIPAALSDGIASSLGCVGNRIYTGISDDEFYTVIGGTDLESIVAEMGTIMSANAALTDYHLERRAALASA